MLFVLAIYCTMRVWSYVVYLVSFNVQVSLLLDAPRHVYSDFCQVSTYLAHVDRCWAYGCGSENVFCHVGRRYCIERNVANE